MHKSGDNENEPSSSENSGFQSTSHGQGDEDDESLRTSESAEKKSKSSNFQTKRLREWPWLAYENGRMKCTYCIENKMSNTYADGTSNFRTCTL